MIAEIPLSGRHGQGRIASVSIEDYEFLSRWRWHFNRVRDGYGRICRGERRGEGNVYFAMARVVLERKLDRTLTPGEEADHIDRDPFNNQRGNLRLASRAANNMNQGLRRDNTSGFKGVCYNKSKGRWQAQIGLNRKLIYLGCHLTAEEAARVYDHAALEFFGEFAVLNFPEETDFTNGGPRRFETLDTLGIARHLLGR